MRHNILGFRKAGVPPPIMKLRRRFGLVGFLIGFTGPVLFYASPVSFFTFESRLVCVWCPYVDWYAPTRWTWIGTGLKFGLFSGLLLALIGLLIGYVISRALTKADRPGYS